MKLTVTVEGGGKRVQVGVDVAKIVGLAAAPGGHCTITIPTRSFVVVESLDAVLLQWLGPGNGAGDEPAPAAKAAAR
jgi:hypothetical protein